MRVGVSSIETDPRGAAGAGAGARRGMVGADLAAEVSHRASRTWCRRSATKRFTVAALDFGIKR